MKPLESTNYTPPPGANLETLLNRVILLAAAQMVALRLDSQEERDHAEAHLLALPDDLQEYVANAADGFEDAAGWMMLKAEDAHTTALKSITDQQVSQVARAFWRRIYPHRNAHGPELPTPLPVEFMAHMATALTWVDSLPQERKTRKGLKYSLMFICQACDARSPTQGRRTCKSYQCPKCATFTPIHNARRFQVFNQPTTTGRQ